MISVIVPVYNEEDGIVSTLTDISRELRETEHEIVVVNDGSTDETLARLKESGLRDIKLINHVENQGYGKSLFDGICVAKYECIAIIDGDGSYPANMIRELYTYYPEYDMIVGARTGNEYKRGLFKRPARWAFKALAEYASGRRIPDVNSGLRIFKKGIVFKFSDSLCTGFSFTTTLTLLFFLNQYYVKYVPVDYLKRSGRSKVSHLKDTLRAMQIIVQAILYYNPIKLFLLLATVNSLFGSVLGILNHFVFKVGFIGLVAALAAASFMPVFAIGLIADLLKQIYKARKETAPIELVREIDEERVPN